jgi:hypothetical protein
MTGACEFLSIIMLVGATGSNSLSSICVATEAGCDRRWDEAVASGGGVIAQCLSIDDLAAMRDDGRKKGSAK